MLKWNVKDQDKGKHGEFDPLWLGPYIISDKVGEHSFLLQEIDGHILEFPIHEQYLKPFFLLVDYLLIFFIK